ncbi:MAG TPA: peroxide stress protein YaaA [Bacteroidales bacterium]|nr:peroxide stress protein YaaA [Bacteroidales bacterium]
MIILLSPAKTLDFESALPGIGFTFPRFEKEAGQLAFALRKLNEDKLSKLLDISPKLAQLNVERYRQWNTDANLAARRPAILAYKGDVYEGLQAHSMQHDDLQFAQNHLRILSGLYGLLRPFDLIQPYRLEMSTALGYGKAKDLYAFWNNRIYEALREDLETQAVPLLINLASQEYAKSVNFKKLKHRVISPEFKDAKDGSYKMISFFTKRARGLMASWIIRNRIEDPLALITFSDEGYVYNAKLSSEDKPVFTRG